MADNDVSPTIQISGDLTLMESERALAEIADLHAKHEPLLADLSGVSNMDTSGAYVIYEGLIARNILYDHLPARFDDLVNRVAAVQKNPEPETAASTFNPVVRLGKFAESTLQQGIGFMAFFGQMCVVGGRLLLSPGKFRWAQITDVIDNAGVKALTIIGLLNFLIGVVIAYQGGEQLKLYGANIFIVPMVSITVLRELAPLITAIIVAGRTGASITARIGSMKVGEEIDAMQTLGMNPFEVLYLPRIIGLIIALPLLTLFADVAAIFGGMVIAATMLDVSFIDFINRIPLTVPTSSLVVGLIKAPVFAATIAMVACYQGQKVENSAESVGRHTTISVVQSIFLVILLDALFSILFNWLGIPIIKT